MLLLIAGKLDIVQASCCLNKRLRALAVLLSLVVLGLTSIVPINANPDAVIARIKVGDNPWGVTVDTKTNRVYVANEESNTVSVIDGLTNSVIANVTGLTSPYHLDVNPTTNRVYVTSSQSNFVSVIDGSVPIPEFADGSLILVLLASIIAAVLVIDRKYRNSSLR